MIKLTHFLGGNYTVTVETTFPPRLLNLCANENLPFWKLSWLSPTKISFQIPQKELPTLKTLVNRQNGTLTIETQSGLPSFLAKFRHRFGFLLGFALSILTVTLLSQFILIIEISGNARTSTGEIRTALENAGFHTGIYSNGLPLSQISQNTLSQLDGISWISINIYGTRATVEVVESTLPPEIHPTDGLYDIISEANGIIEAIYVQKGQALVEEGETILQGQTLISGNVELPPPLYSQEPSLWMSVPSAGEIWARTWREITAVIPLTSQIKSDSGVTLHSFHWNILNKKDTLFQHHILFPTNYEKIHQTFHLPRLHNLNISLTLTQETPYTLTDTPLNQTQAESLLQSRLLSEIHHLIGENGEIITSSFQTSLTDTLLSVTLSAECYEEIGKTVQGTPREPLSLLEVPTDIFP